MRKYFNFFLLFMRFVLTLTPVLFIIIYNTGGIRYRSSCKLFGKYLLTLTVVAVSFIFFTGKV